MMALSIRQPWAWLIIHAGKNIENRTWPTQFRGQFLIHAGKNIDQDAVEIFGERFRIPGDLQTGGIVGSVELADCVTQSDSDWFLGPFGFVLCKPRIEIFRPCKGRLGFFPIHI